MDFTHTSPFSSLGLARSHTWTSLPNIGRSSTRNERKIQYDTRAANSPPGRGPQRSGLHIGAAGPWPMRHSGQREGWTRHSYCPQRRDIVGGNGWSSTSPGGAARGRPSPRCHSRADANHGRVGAGGCVSDVARLAALHQNLCEERLFWASKSRVMMRRRETPFGALTAPPPPTAPSSRDELAISVISGGLERHVGPGLDVIGAI